MRARSLGPIVLIAFAVSGTDICGQARPLVYSPGALRPHQELARDIYKELIEINTGVTTGNVTAAAQAMARRFRDAGIPEADIFVGGPRPEKFNIVA